MLAPSFMKEHFTPDTPAAIWFRKDVSRGSMRGRVRRWEEHKEEMVTYLIFEMPSGYALCLPYSDIYLSELDDDGYDEAMADYELERRLKAVQRKQMTAQVTEAEAGGSMLARPPMMPPSGMPPSAVGRGH